MIQLTQKHEFLRLLDDDKGTCLKCGEETTVTPVIRIELLNGERSIFSKLVSFHLCRKCLEIPE